MVRGDTNHGVGRHWNNEEIASSLWVLIKKINIIQAPRNDD